MHRFAISLCSIALLALVAVPVSAQETFYSSDFEADDGGWTGTGEWEWGVPATSEPPDPNDCTTTPAFPPGANSGANVWGTDLDDCHDADLTSVLSQTFDFSAVSGNIMLCFWHWDNSGGNTFDMATVELNGTQIFIADGAVTVWEEECVPLVGVDNTPSVEITFTFLTTAVVERAGWYIDDVEITADVIPVELTHFGARADGRDVLLTWETASETNNAGFEVQMKQGADWSPLGFVTGNGTTTEAQTYSFQASDLLPGTYTFRLKQIDYDGAFEYSPEVEAAVNVPTTHLLTQAYPNPFNPQARFELAVAQSQHVDIALYNVLGQQVASVFSGPMEANQAQTFTLDGTNLASGTYVVRMTGERFAETMRVTLAK